MIDYFAEVSEFIIYSLYFPELSSYKRGDSLLCFLLDLDLCFCFLPKIIFMKGSIMHVILETPHKEAQPEK